MKAFFLVKNATPADSFELRDIPAPVPKEKEVLIRVSAFGLNYSDVMARQGLYRETPPLPCIIGYDVEGVVEKTGPGVTGYQHGDRVYALTRFGGYAEYACTSINAISKLSADAKTGVGCALATQCVTAYHAAVHSQTLLKGEKVMIYAAAGGVGTALIQIAQWKGCEVIAVAGGAAKAEYLKSMGVKHIIDHHLIDPEDYVQEHLQGHVDVIFDNVGGSNFKRSKSMLAKGGRLVSLGAASLSGKKGILNLLKLVAGFGIFSPISFLTKSQSLIGINMLKIGDFRPDILAHDFDSVNELYDQKIIQPHIGHVFHHTELAAAHSWLENRQSIGKGVVIWDAKS